MSLSLTLFLTLSWIGMFLTGLAFERYLLAPLNAEQARLRRRIALLQRRRQEGN